MTAGATVAELTGIVTRLALNYSKTFDDDEALMALVLDWAEQLDGYDLRDIELARKGLMADPHVRYFPTIGDMRKRVQLARMDRMREDGLGEGCKACVGSGGGIGWAPAGTDDEGNEYVDYCPNGCKPPPANRPPDLTSRRRRLRTQGELPMDDKVASAVSEARDALVSPFDADF